MDTQATETQQTYIDPSLFAQEDTRARPLISSIQQDPRATRYVVQVGHRELQTEARECGYPFLRRAALVPLTGFKLKVSNDTSEALLDDKAPAQRDHEVTPFDAAESLYHRGASFGVAVLHPLTGFTKPRANCIYAAIVLGLVPQKSLGSAKDAQGFLEQLPLVDLIAYLEPQEGETESACDRSIELARLPRNDDELEQSDYHAALRCKHLLLDACRRVEATYTETWNASVAEMSSRATSGEGKQNLDKLDKWIQRMLRLTAPSEAAAVAAKAHGAAQGENLAQSLNEHTSRVVEAALGGRAKLDEERAALEAKEASLAEREEHMVAMMRQMEEMQARMEATAKQVLDAQNAAPAVEVPTTPAVPENKESNPPTPKNAGQGNKTGGNNK